jgi:hypothetical protein
MKPCILLFGILCAPVFSQMVVGTVQKIDKDQLQIKSPAGLVTFHADEKTTVAKVKKANDLSLLAVGDEVKINYYGEETFTAVNISAKITVSGVITQAAPNHITLGAVFVFLDSATKLGVARDQLKVGRKVRVAGWDSGDGVLEAEKVAIE